MFVAAVTTDVSRVTEFLDYMAVFPACDAIGYVVDFEGAGTQFQSLYDIAIANAKNPTQLDQTLRNDWEIKFQKLTGLLARVRAQGADTAAEIIFIDSLINQYGAKCEAYAKKVEYSPYIKPGPFSTE